MLPRGSNFWNWLLKLTIPLDLINISHFNVSSLCVGHCVATSWTMTSSLGQQGVIIEWYCYWKGIVKSNLLVPTYWNYNWDWDKDVHPAMPIIKTLKRLKIKWKIKFSRDYKPLNSTRIKIDLRSQSSCVTFRWWYKTLSCLWQGKQTLQKCLGNGNIVGLRQEEVVWGSCKVRWGDKPNHSPTERMDHIREQAKCRYSDISEFGLRGDPGLRIEGLRKGQGVPLLKLSYFNSLLWALGRSAVFHNWERLCN